MRDRRECCGGRMEMHRDRDFVNEFRGFRPNHRSSHNLTPLRLNDQFHESFDITANNRFLKYVVKRMAGDPRAWGAPASAQQADATRIAVSYKNAWAQDMREADQVDTASGEVIRLPRETQDRTWDDAMKRAEADIAAFMREKAA